MAAILFREDELTFETEKKVATILQQPFTY